MTTTYLSDNMNYASTGAATTGGWVQSGSNAPSIVAGLSGNALRCPGGNGGSAFGIATKLLSGTGALFSVNCQMKCANVSTGAAPAVIRINSGASVLGALRIGTNGFLYFSNAIGPSTGSVVGGSSTYFTANVWHSVRWDFTISTVSTCVIYCDNILRWTASTGFSGTTADRLQLAGGAPFLNSTGADTDFDDIAVYDIYPSARARRPTFVIA